MVSALDHFPSKLILQNSHTRSKKHFIFSRGDLIQAYDPLSLEESGLTENDILLLLNDYNSLMCLEYSQDPITYLIDFVLNNEKKS